MDGLVARNLQCKVLCAGEVVSLFYVSAHGEGCAFSNVIDERTLRLQFAHVLWASFIFCIIILTQYDFVNTLMCVIYLTAHSE